MDKNKESNKIITSEEIININPNGTASLYVDNTHTNYEFILPLQMSWKPKEDITTYELAMCIPYLFRLSGVMPYEIDKSLPHFRHFEINDRNIKNE